MKLSQIKSLYAKKDKMHNWNHIIKLKKTVGILKKPYKKIDEELLNFLITFHGLKSYLKENYLKFDKLKLISIMRHSKNPKLIEEKLVYDANMLDNVGKHGIKKAIFVGRKMNRTDKETYNYLRENISKVKFYTKLGKKIGKKELKIMEKELK